MFWKKNSLYTRFSLFLCTVVLMGAGGASTLHAKGTKSSVPANIQEAVEAKSALLIDVATGEVIFERNTSMHLHPASTTKLMTALLVYEKTHMQGVVTVEDVDTKVEPSHVPLKPGEQVSVSDLMHAMLISSDNDAAMALARHTAGSVGIFVEMMNKRALELGCKNTFFTNPHGLPDSREYTCSEDLLRIFNKVLEIPELREISATRYYSLTTQIGTQRLKNHNKLLGNYPGMGSGKTGWTYASRHTYAASCIRDGRELRLIILNSPNKWSDAPMLLNYGFAHLPELKIPAPSPILASTSIPPTIVSKTPATPTNSTNAKIPVAPATNSAPITNKPSSPANSATTNAPVPTPVKTSLTNASASNIPATPSASVTNATAPVVRPVAQKVIPYTVKKGDTLSSIASKYRCGVEDVLLFNSIDNIDRLQVGQVVYVPVGLVKTQGN